MDAISLILKIKMKNESHMPILLDVMSDILMKLNVLL